MRAGAMIVAVLAVSTGARADPASRKPAPEDATMLGILGSIAGPVVFFAGVERMGDANDPLTSALLGGGAAISVLGPTAGHWYAGDQGSHGLAIRVGAALAIGIGLWKSDARVLAYLGGGAFVVGTLVDIASSADAVRAHQRPVWIVPTVGGGTGGLALGGAF